MPVDVQTLIHDPDFLNWPEARQKEVLKGLVMRGEIAPTPLGGLATPAPTPVPSPMPTPFGVPYAGLTEKLEGGLSSIKRKLGSMASVPGQDTGLSGVAGDAAALAAKIFPGSTGELGGMAAMSAFGGPEVSFIKRLAVPPIIAALTSYMSGSKVSPLTAGISTGIGTTVGEGIGIGSRLAKGGVIPGSKPLAGRLLEDLSQIGDVLHTNLPEVVTKQLERPAEFLDYFQHLPEDYWGTEKDTAEKMIATAKARAKSALRMPTNVRQYYQNQAAQMLQQGQQLLAAYKKKAGQFESLAHFFGNIRNYKGGTKDLAFKSEELQDFVSSPMGGPMRKGGIPSSVADRVKQVIFGADPTTPPSEVMTQADVPPVHFNPGGRMHQYHGPPTLGAHINIPEGAQLAGNRQEAITPAEWLEQFVKQISSRTVYGLGSLGDEDITYPTPAATPSK